MKALLIADTLVVFLLLFVLPAAALAMIALSGVLNGYFVLFLIWLAELLIMSWNLALGHAIHKRRPRFSGLGGLQFRMYLVSGFELKWVGWVLASLLETRGFFLALLLLFSSLLLGIGFLVYAWHLMAVSIALIEGEGKFDPNRYTTATGELWFPPVGIWWLQPRIRAILLNPCKQDWSDLAGAP